MKALRPHYLASMLAALCLTAGIGVRAQNTEVIHKIPLHARHLSGVVVDSKGMTIEYATVELHDAKTHQLIASTYADGKGHFSFDDQKYGKRIELRAIQKGFNAARYTVTRRPFADESIRLVLPAAS